MKLLFALLLTCSCIFSIGQTAILTKQQTDGRMTLSDKGASYFANLSLSCASKVYPHFYNFERLQTAADLKSPDKMWPSFYGCYDWHSGVHNHWALVKLLKNYPQIPEAKKIKERLEISFNPNNIKEEIAYFKKHEGEYFEYPYGTGWLLKVAAELHGWRDTTAQRWFTNLEPLAVKLADQFMFRIPYTSRANKSGDHYATSIGLSFLYDYGNEMKIDSITDLVKTAAKFYYGTLKNYPLANEPVDYDFMSGGLLIADLMGRVYTQSEYEKWLKGFAPDLLTKDGFEKVLFIKKMDKHDEFESHFDGFHLNRIWGINSMLKYVSDGFLKTDIKQQWISKQKDLWNYAQESIGKGNYDIDHWLSSFSVYALEGNK